MERKDIISIIPEPRNEEVVLYDLDLKSLIDIEVIEEYKKLLADYKIKRENYILLDKELKQYEKSLNNIYLYNKSWSEKDYIDILQKDKKTYSNYYNDIKKIENNIVILEHKYKAMNELIEIQRKAEINEVETKRENISNEIKELRSKISKLHSNLSELKLDKNRYKKQIEDIEEDLKICFEMQNELDNKEFKCQYCGTHITTKQTKIRVSNVLNRKIKKNNEYLESYKASLEQTEREIAYYQKELKENQTTLKNDIEFKKQDYNFYIKKSVKILELEANRDTIQQNILKLKDEYDKNQQTKTKDYQTLKDRISKCELSLQNLQKIKQGKETFSEKYKILNNLKPVLLEMNEKLKLYKKFIEIYYKIYEQKAADYFGNNIKFKLYKFNSLDLEEIFEVYYNDIEYTQLHPKQREEFDKLYAEKILFLS